ncbi:MAG: helix-turn-helix transcriptional regulator [Rhizobiales bacterium]|nr:helix-turn-helix transcriptional regulator [Hyphomicrobiales bacterium]
MTSQAHFAEVAALVGDPARASMLHGLLDGRALTASELAALGGITPQTASGHLAKLTEAGLITVVRQGRHRYHRLASAHVAQMMESIMCVAAGGKPPRRQPRTGPRDAALRAARTCYDHLAGTLAVALADAMIDKGLVELSDDAGIVTERGAAFIAELGLDDPSEGSRRVFCRPCLDWSERRAHLAGRVGAALRHHSFERGWIRRLGDSRAVTVTPKGQQAFREHFGLRTEDLATGGP